MALTIPELAIKCVDNTISKGSADTSRTILFVGNKAVGKSTLINSLLEKSNENLRETLALEYSFGRKSKTRHSMDKILCHIWEYGGKLELLSEVLSFIPRTDVYTALIVLDLSKLKKIWNALETSLDAIKSIDCLSSERDVTKRPNIVIIGGKYDVFKNYDNEIKKSICVTLRSIALLNHGHLFFYSSKEGTLAKRIKEILHYFAFGSNNLPSEKVYSYNKPLCIANGLDSWESIGTAEQSFDIIKANHLAKFPVDLDDDVAPPAVLQTAHAEPILDALKKQKIEDLQTLDTMDLSINDYLRSLR